MKHLFIINPNAGEGNALKIIPHIKNIFETLNEDPIIEITERPGHATEIVHNYVQQEDYRVYSVGGDGTLNEVLNGIINSNSLLGIIPAGSGNDFIKSILNDTLPLDKLLMNTICGESRKADVGVVNGKYFINISSIGFDADVTQNSRKLKKLPFVPSKLAYLLGIFTTALKHKNKPLELKFDNEIVTAKTTLMAVANGRFYGGGMLVAPKANLDDGVFDICLVQNASIFKILTLFPKLIKGVHESLEIVTFYKAKKINVFSKKEINLNIDGEVILSKNITFEIIPKGINIIYPIKQSIPE